MQEDQTVTMKVKVKVKMKANGQTLHRRLTS